MYSTRLADLCGIDLASCIKDSLPSSKLGTTLLSGNVNEWVELELDFMLEPVVQSHFSLSTPRHLTLGLVGCAGSICTLFSKKSEEECSIGLPLWSREEKLELSNHLSNTCLLLSALANTGQLSLSKVVTDKIGKNEAKYPVDLVKGRSEKYTYYKNLKRGHGNFLISPMQAFALLSIGLLFFVLKRK